jgi:hypothetical protein
LDGLATSDFKTYACFKDLAWSFSRPEPGKTHLAGDLAERCIEVAVEFGLVDLDRQFDFVAF